MSPAKRLGSNPPASLQRCVETAPQFLPMLKSKKLLNAYAGAF
jgi:hypothetical protein